MPSSPSKEATGADADASNPERDHVLSNPLELLGRRRQKRPVREPAGGEQNAVETSEMEEEEERRLMRPVATEDPLGCREPADNAHEKGPRYNSGAGGVP
ncbi:hypothetical protein NDU88_004886 [Pleurodeles waltl]|uniref:Uncharacterized protein n=1 Tax=Pleurodeles waltl TaxID=8319 RepID=A0AAV7RIM1_PLEWA|nr:hypothetical protein NDU88_004886 [Pleurodeles waltl]